MKEYIQPAKLVKAEQFLPNKTPWPPGVIESKGKYGIQYCVKYSFYSLPVFPKDWIVVSDSGDIQVLPPKKFNEKYVEII